MTVYLVGAGPGDPGLLTTRGATLLAEADVVVYDRLIDPALLSLAPPGAELIDVGKRPTGTAEDAGSAENTDNAANAQSAVHVGPGRQREINELLIAHGRSGRRVVRLKGGDPFLFGRGGEEAEALEAAGIPWEVVPGVSSATAVPAYAGIPVTHRGRSTSVTVVTGHVGDPTAEGGVDWDSLAKAQGTLVILMGMATREEIARRLQAGGRAPSTPVAVVEWGTLPVQRVARTTLGELHAVELGSPAVIVVGEVAGLDLEWLPERTLLGMTVVVTRPRGPEGADPFAAALGAAGARVVGVPVLQVVAPEDGLAALREAAARVADYDWVAFTSANAVRSFVPLLRDGRDLEGVRLAAVGGATAAALTDYHLVADLVPERKTAAGLAAAMTGAPKSRDPALGSRVLFPRAADAREELPQLLVEAGWSVDEVIAYRTVGGPPPPTVVADQLARADVVTFASPSAVSSYLSLRDEQGRQLAVPPTVACIGPVTAKAAKDAGLEVAVESASPSASALVTALEAFWGRRPPGP